MAFFISLVLLITVIVLGYKNLIWGGAAIVAIRILIPPIARLGSLSLNTACLITFGVICIIKYYRSSVCNEFIQGSFFSPFNILILPIAVISLLSTISYAYQLGELTKFFLTEVLIFYVLFVSIRCIKDSKLLINTILISYSIAGLYGILTYIFKSNIYVTFFAYLYGTDESLLALGDGLEMIRGGLNSRATGTMQTSLIWGQVSLVIVLLIIKIQEYFNLKYSVSVLFLASINVFLSGHRSCILPMLIVVVYFVYKFYNIKIIDIVKIIFVIPLLLIFLYNFKPIQGFTKNIETAIFFWDDDLANKYETNGSSLEMRTEQLSYCLSMISNNPLCGHGYGYPSYYYNVMNRSSAEMRGFESIFFVVLVSSGYLGLIVWVLFFWKCYKNTSDIRNNEVVNFFFHGGYVLSLLLTGIQTSFFFYMMSVSLLYKLKILNIIPNK